MALEAEYFKIHNWLIYYHGRATKCENEKCKSTNPKRFEWALLKGKDYKRDRNNYIQLCPSCHRKYDYTDQQRKNISKAKSGKSLSESHKKQLSKSMKGKNNVPVVKLDKNNNVICEYKSVSEASNKCNILQQSISNCLIGISKLAGGFIWQYKQMNSE